MLDKVQWKGFNPMFLTGFSAEVSELFASEVRLLFRARFSLGKKCQLLCQALWTTRHRIIGTWQVLVIVTDKLRDLWRN